jgi:hypothetical protein
MIPLVKQSKHWSRFSTNPYAHNWYTVWQGDAYTAIGNWTDEELADAVTAIVVAEYPPALLRG